MNEICVKALTDETLKESRNKQENMCFDCTKRYIFLLEIIDDDGAEDSYILDKLPSELPLFEQGPYNYIFNLTPWKN